MIERPTARELTAAEADELIADAMETERRIKAAIRSIDGNRWTLAQALYDFHEQGGWKRCGFDTLDDFLAQPSIELSRRASFRAVALWRDLVVVKRVEPERLRTLSPNKVDEVRPAIMAGNVGVDAALADVDELTILDLREKYVAALPGKVPTSALSLAPPEVPTPRLSRESATSGTDEVEVVTARITVAVEVIADDDLVAMERRFRSTIGSGGGVIERIEVEQ